MTTFSSHSMPFRALVDIDFWQTNVVSEDSRIFWQCFLYYDGDWRVEPLFQAVSMDANVAPTFWGTIRNQYKQQRRWGYGAENIPYLLYAFTKNKNIPALVKLREGFLKVEAFHSWATNSIMIFLLGWLPIWLGGDQFTFSVLSFNLPEITRTILMFASIGIATSAILSIILLPPKPEGFRFYHYVLYMLQWILLPITLIVFGAFPAIEAQTRMMLGRYMGFWFTPKYEALRGPGK
jgi:cellulose synthase/poly-beta-1,6-N-acetylglucosamine synthase-like glycosyltransferase